MTIHVRLRTYFIEYPVIFFWVSIVLNDDDLVTVTVCVKNHVSYSNPINTDIYNRIRTRHMVSPNRLCSKAVSPYFINTYPPPTFLWLVSIYLDDCRYIWTWQCQIIFWTNILVECVHSSLYSMFLKLTMMVFAQNRKLWKWVFVSKSMYCVYSLLLPLSPPSIPHHNPHHYN